MDARADRIAAVDSGALRIVILDHGEQIKLIEIPDPRGQLIEQFNHDWADTGLEAKVA